MSTTYNVDDKALQQAATRYMLEDLGGGLCTVHFGKNALTITHDTVLADVVEADYMGYTAQNIDSWSIPLSVPVGHVVVIVSGNTLTFTTDPGATAQTVYYYYILDPDAELAWIESLDPPRVMEPGATLTITPRLQFLTCGP